MASNYKFSGLLKCEDCNNTYIGKMQRSVPVYICTGYHRKISNCKRYAIKESEIEEMIEKHRRNLQKEYNVDDSASYIRGIGVYTSENGYVIRYKDFSHESIVSKTHLRY